MSKPKPTLGHLKAELAESSGPITDDLIDRLNFNCRPPEPLEADQVFIRAMFILSDEVNSYGGRFPVDEHEHLSELLIDSPVMVGHRQDKLPVGRNFHAVSVEREGRYWVKSYFYWLRSADGAENLLKNIDGGVYKECSIGFSFRFPECSICGKDIRLCEHEPFAKYVVAGTEATCHFNYRQIEKVLETSLVYRGAIRNTSISNELSQFRASEQLGVKLPQIDSLTALDESARFMILPRYDSVAARMSISEGTLSVFNESGEIITSAPISSKLSEQLGAAEDTPIRLVGMRGKERCSLSHLFQFISNHDSPVSRMQVLVMPSEQIELTRPIRVSDRIELKRFPFRTGSFDRLERLAREIGTRDGVEIWNLDERGRPLDGVNYIPRMAQDQNRHSYYLSLDRTTGRTELALSYPVLGGTFVISHWSTAVQSKGERLIGRIGELKSVPKGTPAGTITHAQEADDGWCLTLSGRIAGDYFLRPVRLSGEERWLFYPASLNQTRRDRSCA